MTRPWNPNRRLSDAEYRALSPTERRALFAARAEARSKRSVELAYERALGKHERRYRATPSRYRKGYFARQRLWWFLATLVIIYVALPIADRISLALGSPVASSAEVASDAVPVRADFGACKWGGGTNCVVDGDTIYLAGQKVRIAGIDAPETHDYQCESENALGEQAAARLQQLVNSGPITLTSIDRDEDVYGRKLRHVAVDGKDVGETLIAEGLARAYAGGRRSWCV